MLNNVIQFITRHTLIQSGSRIVVGLSGGPDSVCLLHILSQLKEQYALTLIAAHIDHEWRASSYEDALFCESFASSLSIPFTQLKASQSTIKQNQGSKEDLGRRIRRAFFEEEAKRFNADHIALAHHANDQQETFLLRMIRGASIAGLSSIRPAHGLYIRPLLSSTKQEILSYLEEHNLPYRTDHTNEQDTYLRNALRIHVLPALQQCDTRFEKNFSTTLSHIQETELFLERLTQAAFERISSVNETGMSISISCFFKEDPFLHHRLILKWLCAEKVPFNPSTSLFNEIVRFFKAQGTRHQVTSAWSLVKTKGYVSLRKTL